MLATCLLLTGTPGFGSFSFSSALLSLSLLFPDPALSPLGAVPCWLQYLSLVPSTLVLRLVIFLVGCLFVSLRFLRGWHPVVALSRLLGGVQLFCFPVAPSLSVLPALSGALGGLPGSLLCLPPGYGSSCFYGSLWFGLVLQLPSMRALRSALFGPLAVHRFFPRVSSVWTLLDSSLLCYLASWLVLGSSFQVLVEPGLPPIRGSLFGLIVLP